MKDPYVATEIDGQNLNARYYVSLGKNKAIEKLIKDLEATTIFNKEWAAKAYDKMEEQVRRKDKELGIVPVPPDDADSE
jgi:hypothetical protein